MTNSELNLNMGVLSNLNLELAKPKDSLTFREDMVSVLYGTIAWCILYITIRQHPILGK